MRERRDAGRKLLVPYVTGGLGSGWLDVVRAVALAGADAIEVGIPFSDPVMDGRTIQEASQRALDIGATPQSIVADLARAEVGVPIAVMTYYNPVHHVGHERFAAQLVAGNVDAAIIPDLPLDELDGWAVAADAAGIETVLLAAPTTSDERLRAICERSRGFVYGVALMGVTGEREHLARQAGVMGERLKAVTDLPVLLGVGISNPEQAAEAAKSADGVIVGQRARATVARRWRCRGRGAVHRRAPKGSGFVSPASEWVELSTPDGPMASYVARPAGDARGAVVVVQEAFGVNGHIQDVTDRLATAGYLGIAPTFFHRAGGGTAPYDDFAKVLPLYEGLTDDGILMDLDAVVAHLGTLGYEARRDRDRGLLLRGAGHVPRVRVPGAGCGGRLLRRRDRHRTVPAVPPLVEHAAELKTPWLGLFGDADGGIPIEDVELLRSALTGASEPSEIVRYEGAEHGFHCDQRSSFHPAAAADAWARTLAWLEQHLAKST